MKYFYDCAKLDAQTAATRRGFSIAWSADSVEGKCKMTHPGIGAFSFVSVGECLRWLRAFELGWISGRECPDIDLLPDDDDIELILDDDVAETIS